MQQSEHFNMNLPEGPDHYNVEDFNSNTRVIDEKMYEFENHTLNTNNPHGVTKTQLGLGNVENKSSAMIRSELTSTDVENALGYTAMNIDGSNAAAEVTFGGAFTVGNRANNEIVGLPSVVEGHACSAGLNSHAEGEYSKAPGHSAHAEGGVTEAIGDLSHAEGNSSIANGTASHAEGNYTIADGDSSHAEGYAEGLGDEHSEIKASGIGAHAEGYSQDTSRIIASGKGAHAEGSVYHTAKIIASGDGAHAEGTANGSLVLEASGGGSHAEGGGTKAGGMYSHAEGYRTTTNYGTAAHSEGYSTKASDQASHSEGMETEASGKGAHAEGYRTLASGLYSHAEGYSLRLSVATVGSSGVQSTNYGSHAEGCTESNGDSQYGKILASGKGAHAEGYSKTALDWIQAIGVGSHAEGSGTFAYADYCHAEGKQTNANGIAAHAEGSYTVAGGAASHAEGSHTSVSSEASASHAEGLQTITEYPYQHVQGRYNLNKYNTLFEIGKGTESSRSNAFEVYNNGYISQNDGVDKYKFASVDGHDGYYTADGVFHGFNDGGGVATSDYSNLYNKPQINGHTLDGNLSSTDLDIAVETYEDATQSTHGLMSTSDKIKLDGVEANANNYSHPTESGYKHIPSGGQSGQVLGWSSDGVAQWVSNETYQDATQSTHGLMSASDKTKLDSIEAYEDATQSSHGLMSTSDKTKLDGIANNANNYAHPTGSGFNHIPTGGRSGQVLGWDSDGTAKWITPSGGGGTGDGMATDGSNADNDIAFPSQTVSFGFDRNEWYNGTVYNLSKPAGENQTVTFITNGMSEAVHRVMHSFRLFFPLPLSDESYYPFPKLKVRINNEDRFLRLFSMEEVDSFQDRFWATFENDTSEQIDLSECDLYYPAYDEYTYDGMTTSYSYGSGFMAAHGTSLGAFNMTADGGFTLGYGCAAGERSVATGSSTVAIMGASHAEGESCFASGPGSHAEGTGTTASGGGHAEGWKTSASGINSHSEGINTVASGEGSHSEGADSVAGGNYSHVGGCGALAARANQFVQGGGSDKLNSLFSCNASAAFGFQPDIEYYIENTEITNGQCGCGGCMSQNITMTIHLEPLGVYSLYCSSFESDGSVYGAVYGMITATGNGGSPTWLPVSQTSTDAVQIQMLANDKISIQNTQTGAQFHLIRIM